MAVTITTQQREFRFNNTELPDPDATLSPEKVMSFYSSTYPELTNGFVKETKNEGDKMIYEIGFSVGNKG